MKNIITAIGNERLNEELKSKENIKILNKDIQYREGILEILESENKIDFIIISDNIPGEIGFLELIKQIKNKHKNINIILVLSQNDEELESKLKNIEINNIFFNEIKIEEILKIINQKNNNEELKNEIENLKKIILENNNIKKNKNNDNNNKLKLIKLKNKLIDFKKIKKKIIKFNKINKKAKNKIISVLGTGGVGKSIFIINLINILKLNKNKILIIDFDILNNSLHTILEKNKYNKKIKNKINNFEKININDLIIKINKKIDLISGVELLFDSKYKINNYKLEKLLKDLKEKYDIILIDTSSECIFDYTQCLVQNSDKAIFLIEANLLEIKKSKRLLEIYLENWNIKKEKINIVFNKYNLNAINLNILKNIFNEIKIIGKINFNKNYNLIINKNNRLKNKLINLKIRKEYLKIINKIF